MENKNHKLILGILILFLICFALLYCNRGVNKLTIHTTNNDSIYIALTAKNKANDSILLHNIKLTAKLDSLSKVKSKVVHHYHNIYDSLIIADTSCVGSLVLLYNECNKVNKVNDSIISDKTKLTANLITITNNQQDIIDTQRFKINSDSITMIDLKESFKAQKKRNKRNVIKGTVIGVVGGLIGGLIIK
jgi:hypothetical protein